MRKHQRLTLVVLSLLSSISFFAQAEAPRTLFATLPSREALPPLRGDPFSRERQERRASASRPTPPAAPDAVEAPPNPYRFAGEVRQAGSARRFLVRGNDIFEVSEGDVLSDGYRVEAVTEKEVVLLHIGTGLRQTLAQTRA